MEAEALEREIRAFLEEKLGITGIDRDGELVSSGLVDSGSLVRLATQVERIAGIEIPDRDIDADHFDSLAMIVDYAVSKAR
ncbi:MAG: phosphopantetheine-binding protein [Myxococcota bacterium]|nr:phosphopantetheine-binding protein [Myxococcota bacterium]